MEVCRKELVMEYGLTDWIDVFPLGDIHEGAANCDESALERAVEMIRLNKIANHHTYTILMGDLIDCIVSAHDPRWNPVEIASKYSIRDLKDLPKRQADRVLEKLRPIENTVVAILIGNHEEEYIKRHYFDVYNYMWSQLKGCGTGDLPFKLGYVGMLRFALTTRAGGPFGVFDFALNHGQGGSGKREGYPLNLVYDTFRWFAADYRIMGHIHLLVADDMPLTGINHRGTGLTQTVVWHGVSGCFYRTHVEGHRSYFEHKGKELSEVGMLKCSFRMRKALTNNYVKQTKMERIRLEDEDEVEEQEVHRLPGCPDPAGGTDGGDALEVA